MDKKQHYLCILLIFILNINSFIIAEQGTPTALALGLNEGKIASISLQDWKIKYYSALMSKSLQPIGIKYYSKTQKVVFVMFNYDYTIGLLDLKSDNVKYFNSLEFGIRGKIIDDIRMSKKNTNDEIFLLFSDKHLASMIHEKDLNSYFSMISVVNININQNSWKVITNHNKEDLFADFNEQWIFPNGKVTGYLLKNHSEQKKNGDDIEKYVSDTSTTMLNMLINNKIITARVEDSILYFGERYLVCKKDKQLIILDMIQKERPIIISKSPDNFLDGIDNFDSSVAVDLIF